ncbi:pyridoxal-phosphate dependent enzyme [Zhongshania sp.]|jgi:cysteine synthase A|uniref:pyridoxal-phosphate dependent enzyme n=1 Tax=Zhongshania sp. TaxID=1971902 RepID=UPI0039E27790
MSATFNDLSLTTGNNPLVKINRISKHNIFVKMQSRNPANSVKCRRGANMIWQAEQDGLLKPGMEIVEPTSGNTGIALAFVAAARGYPITLTKPSQAKPSSMSIERRKVLLALGAKIILSDGKKE